MTPYEACNRLKQHVHLFIVFGCIAYSHSLISKRKFWWERREVHLHRLQRWV